MKNLIVPILFILASAGLFFMYIDPSYQGIQSLQQQNARLEQALEKARELQAVRDQLLSKYNTFAAEDLERLQKLLPDNIDNVRLILDLDNIAAQYGLIINDFGFVDADDFGVPGPEVSPEAPGNTGGGPGLTPTGAQLYQSVLLEFSVDATYEEFLRFASDLEKSLRVVDVSAVALDPGTGDDQEQAYSYRVGIKTYWLP